MKSCQDLRDLVPCVESMKSSEHSSFTFAGRVSEWIREILVKFSVFSNKSQKNISKRCGHRQIFSIMIVSLTPGISEFSGSGATKPSLVIHNVAVEVTNKGQEHQRIIGYQHFNYREAELLCLKTKICYRHLEDRTCE